MQAKFETSANSLENTPSADLPEFAFVGRSNVGKSSLINHLTKQKGLAVTSSKPGRTRLLNFFNIDRRWRLVDLPGYGYAKASKADKKQFQAIVTDYLLNRESLKCVFALVDAKIPPQEIDLAFTQWLMEAGIPFVLVFTKADRVKPHLLRTHQDAFLHSMSAFAEELPRFYTCSTKDPKGRDELLKFIRLVLDAQKNG